MKKVVDKWLVVEIRYHLKSLFSYFLLTLLDGILLSGWSFKKFYWYNIFYLFTLLVKDFQDCIPWYTTKRRGKSNSRDSWVLSPGVRFKGVDLMLVCLHIYKSVGRVVTGCLGTWFLWSILSSRSSWLCTIH